MTLKILVPFMALYACPIYHPVPDSSPTPAPTASETPQVTPSALPEPSVAPTVQVCDLPPSSAPQAACEIEPGSESEFWESLSESQRLAEANGYSVGGHVVSEAGYTSEVARMLRSMGLCATNEGLPDEVWIKSSNEFSEHFDVVTSGGEVWQEYSARCSPAKW